MRWRFSKAVWTIMLIFFLLGFFPLTHAQNEKKGKSVVKTVLLGPASLINIKKKKEKTEQLNLTNVGDMIYLGIAEFKDSVSNLSRSFALHQLMKERPVVRDGVPIEPVFVDYPFSAPYAVSGLSTPSGTLLKFFEKGKKVAEHKMKKGDWQSIWLKINDWLGGEPLVLSKKEKVDVDEGSGLEMNKFTPIAELLPGKDMQIKIPDHTVITRTTYLNIWPWGGKNSLSDPYAHLRQVYGNYTKFNEDEIYFFKGVDVPNDAQNAARALALPLYRTPRPALQYLGTEKLLFEKKDLGAAYLACLSALSASDDIFIGPQEQALIREKAFSNMAKVQIAISPNRKQTEALFQFASKLNQVYSKDTLSISESIKYYAAIDPLKNQLTESERMANKVRNTRIMGMMNAAGSFMGGVAGSIGGASQAVTQPYMNLMQSTLNQTMATTSAMRSKLTELFSNIDRNVNAKSFLAGQELEVDFGKPLVAAEVYFHLSRHPELMKEPLGEYSSDKPQLYKLLREYYLGKTPEKSLMKVYEHFTMIERIVLNYEIRGYAIPPAELKKF